MILHVRSLEQIQTQPLPGPSGVVCMADSIEQLAVIQDEPNVAARLDLVFNDATDPFGIVMPPTAEHARLILDFINSHRDLPNIVFQCQVGIGRSMAAMAALIRIDGGDNSTILRGGTYNRALYRKLLESADFPPEPEPLVSMAVRVKYAPDRLRLLLLSMRRQRYDNWEVVAVTDGPNPAAGAVVAEFADRRVRLIQTDKPLGRWGHPYRQLGLNACRGEFIGMSNDDNYYVPGYLEQMVAALKEADLAVCKMLHSYFAWDVMAPGMDLGAWIARASLVRRVPWTGCEFTSDKDYIAALRAQAGSRVVAVERPLFVHN